MLKIINAILETNENRLEELRLYEFDDDEEAHDDDLIEDVYEEFEEAFERLEKSISKKYGEPLRTGNEDDDVMPLSGVFHFTIWQIGPRLLFLAIAHEDRELPICLFAGTVAAPEAKKKGTRKK